MAARRACTLAVVWAALSALLLAGARAPLARAEIAGFEPEYRTRPPLSPPRKRAWEREHGGREAAREALWRRLEGWPSVLLADRDALLALSDQALLDRIARDTWRGLAALTDREHGLPMNHVLFPKGSLAPLHSQIGDYASTTDIGVWMVAVVAAHDLALIGREEALARLRRTLDSLDELEKIRGFFFNYYDTTTLERTSDFVSFVDSAWLASGLMVARQAFPELAKRCGAMLARRDFGHFYDRRERLMVHGFYVDPLRRSPYHYGMLYAESRLGSLVAIGKGDVPASHWEAMTRVERWSRNGQRELERPTRGARAGGRFVPPQRTVSGYFEWKGYRFVPSWGGSMFEALMPMLLVDELRLAPYGLGPNARVHVAVQQRYALDHLGYPVWGMSPSWRPDGSGYQEYGVRVLGVAGYPGQAVTPHASALALMVDPVAAIANLRELIRRYPIYGDFGFYDSVAPQTGEVAQAYLVLDQAMILVALANHLAGGAIQQRFAADPIARRALSLLAEERFPNSGPHLPNEAPRAR
ncbi:MAG TPA: glucoamylase family protein [Myxococcota bacterium]